MYTLYCYVQCSPVLSRAPCRLDEKNGASYPTKNVDTVGNTLLNLSGL